MLLVRVGPYTINVDHIAAFIEEGDKTTVVFTTANGNGPSKGIDGLSTIELDGEASRQLRHWIARNAESGRGRSTGFSMLPEEE